MRACEQACRTPVFSLCSTTWPPVRLRANANTVRNLSAAASSRPDQMKQMKIRLREIILRSVPRSNPPPSPRPSPPPPSPPSPAVPRSILWVNPLPYPPPSPPPSPVIRRTILWVNPLPFPVLPPGTPSSLRVTPPPSPVQSPSPVHPDIRTHLSRRPLSPPPGKRCRRPARQRHHQPRATASPSSRHQYRPCDGDCEANANFFNECVPS